ncbi:hypothetical protein JXB41_06115 [Candidatus Woesearchaeota archaeon]|nr:hypothetical protein [Candidatus Woesearchaeota archaeon]
MKYKIGVMGSHNEPLDKSIIIKSRELGKAIAENKCILVNGATSGLPDESARGAKEAGGFVLGISPAHDPKDHVKNYKMPTKYYDSIVYTGFGFNLRNIINIRTSDAVVFLRGSMGTLNEFTIAYEDRKIIGVLEQFGGVSEFFDEIVEICKKDTGAKIIYDSDPYNLVKKLVKEIKQQSRIEK